MFGLGTTELLIILVIIVMLFGLGKLPRAAKQLGLGARNFQKGLKGEDDDPEVEPKKLERSSDEKAGGDWAEEPQKHPIDAEA